MASPKLQLACAGVDRILNNHATPSQHTLALSTMSRRAVTLPLRLVSAPKQQPPQPWTCRRCLATQATSTTSTPSDSTSPPPPGYGDPRLPASERIDPATGRPTPLSEVDRLLKKPLRQLIPPQYLEHSTVEWLHENERAQRERTRVHRKIVGVVVSTGKMAKTVKVRVPTQRWEPKIGKVRRPTEKQTHAALVKLLIRYERHSISQTTPTTSSTTPTTPSSSAT